MGDKYKTLKRDGRYIDKHRYIMEQHLGRELNTNEVVHHINGDATDNRIENLELMSMANHSSLHSRDRAEYIEIKCSFCRELIKIRKASYKWKKKKQKKFYCSKSCAWYGIAKGRFGKCVSDYRKNVENGIKKGWSGYRISKEYNMNKGTVYNYLKRLKKTDSIV